MQQTILIFDFGSQYTQLIARRVRELNVYCEIHPYTDFEKVISSFSGVMGVILSGSPFSVRNENSPEISLNLVKGKLPLLGICYGAQLLSHKLGGEVSPSETREYGRANLTFIDTSCALFKGINSGSQVWMSHGDTINKLPKDATLSSSTKDVKNAGFRFNNEHTYGIQFHPEVYHTTDGLQLLKNFVYTICNCKGEWTPASFAETTVNNLKQKLGNDKVVMALSGGVDSTVAAILLHKAIGDNLYCIFVDNGLLRKNEFNNVLEKYKEMHLNVKGVDARKLFYDKLKGVTEPEEKRKIIGKYFIEVFDEESHKLTDIKWLGQGTIYPDVIESKSVKGPSATIKSHHNVGGLPDFMKLKIVEPLNTLFKDEVRRVGKELNISSAILERHPFPGPGLGIRILGDITPEKVQILQEVDFIFIEGLKSSGLYKDVWQAGAILLPVQSVGVMGDERTYENAVALRAVTSTDGMTADWCHLPYEFLAKISNEIINKVKGVNRVVYDISSKPPATIEWE
jgi:GMP synthase (glutamine-hydrolysing)